MRRPAAGRIRSVFEVAGQQFPDDGVLFGAGDQARRGIAGALGGPPQDRVGVAVHGADQRLTDRGAARTRGAGTQQRRRQRGARPHPEPARTGKQQNVFRVNTGGDARDRGVDQQAALTGARAAEDTRHRPRIPGCSTAPASAPQVNDISA